MPRLLTFLLILTAFPMSAFSEYRKYYPATGCTMDVYTIEEFNYVLEDRHNAANPQVGIYVITNDKSELDECIEPAQPPQGAKAACCSFDPFKAKQEAVADKSQSDKAIQELENRRNARAAENKNCPLDDIFVHTGYETEMKCGKKVIDKNLKTNAN